MTQYLMQKEKDFEHLQYALDNYQALRLVISPFSLGNSKLCLAEDLENKILKFSLEDDGLRLFTDKELMHFPLKMQNYGFKLEYRESNDMRIYPYFNNPNDPQMPMPAKSVFRSVIDDSLLEIAFKGKILLELDTLVKNNLGNSYWKLLKIA